jgi:hypothetical protein
MGGGKAERAKRRQGGEFKPRNKRNTRKGKQGGEFLPQKNERAPRKNGWFEPPMNADGENPADRFRARVCKWFFGAAKDIYTFL